jgi:hypothetical protein
MKPDIPGYHTLRLRGGHFHINDAPPVPARHHVGSPSNTTPPIIINASGPISAVPSAAQNDDCGADDTIHTRVLTRLNKMATKHTNPPSSAGGGPQSATAASARAAQQQQSSQQQGQKIKSGVLATFDGSYTLVSSVHWPAFHSFRGSSCWRERPQRRLCGFSSSTFLAPFPDQLSKISVSSHTSKSLVGIIRPVPESGTSHVRSYTPPAVGDPQRVSSASALGSAFCFASDLTPASPPV